MTHEQASATKSVQRLTLISLVMRASTTVLYHHRRRDRDRVQIKNGVLSSEPCCPAASKTSGNHRSFIRRYAVRWLSNRVLIFYFWTKAILAS
jgi:hypothetical protein